jgi:hypothetical protein
MLKHSTLQNLDQRVVVESSFDDGISTPVPALLPQSGEKTVGRRQSIPVAIHLT